MSYTTVDMVGNILGFPNAYFSASSTPSKSVIENFIRVAEARIDSQTGHSWKPTTISDEVLQPVSLYIRGSGIRFNLAHRKINSVTKFEIWNGSVWEDFVAEKTEGRNNDYWVDYKNGVIFLLSARKIFVDGVKISYIFGDETVPYDIQDCASKIVAISILNSPEFSSVLFSQAGVTRPNYSDTKTQWNNEIQNIIENNVDFG